MLGRPAAVRFFGAGRIVLVARLASGTRVVSTPPTDAVSTIREETKLLGAPSMDMC